MPKPTTLSECFQFLDNIFPDETKSLLKQLRHDELWQVYFKLAPIIQSEILNDNEALAQRFENTAFCDSSGLAERILAAYWDDLQIRRG